MILAIAAAWLFLIVLALAVLRAAGAADRAAEQRIREARAPRFRRVAAEQRRRTVTTAVVAVALPLAGAGLAAPDADARGCRGARSAASGSSAASATVCLINRERRARGLAPLVANPRLARAARRHASDMVARAFFSHVTPDGGTFSDRLRRAGYMRGCSAWGGGETIAWGSGIQASPASRVAGWMHSPPHRAILLGRFREVGIGVASGSPADRASGATYAGEFGRRRC